MDLRVFLLAQPWILDLASDEGRKRARTTEAELVVFEGLACFLGRPGAACAVAAEPGAAGDWLSMAIKMVIASSRLVVYFSPLSAAPIRAAVDHGAVRFVKVSRPLPINKRPPWVGFEFGNVEVRLWRNDGQDFAMALVSSLCTHLERPPPVSIRYRFNTRQVLDRIAEAAKDRRLLAATLTGIVQAMRVSHENADG